MASVVKGRPKSTTSLYGEASYGCAFRTGTSDRIRVVATIDGVQVVAISATTAC